MRQTTRLYTQSCPEPVEIPDPGRRLMRFRELAWVLRAARTTVHGADVYVELEELPLPGVTCIRRHRRAIAYAYAQERARLRRLGLEVAP